MIVGNAIEVPKEKTTLLSFGHEELKNNDRCRTYHLREDGHGFVAAAGEEDIYMLPEGFTKVAAVPGRVLAYNPTLAQAKSMDKLQLYLKVPEPCHFFRYFSVTGQEELYCVTRDSVLYLFDHSTASYGIGKGGVVAALFRERVFTGNGLRLYYSRALNGKSWDDERYGSGYILFQSDDGGDILGLHPYKDKLYLMRRRGISVLRVLGDELNFKAIHLPMKCGSLVEESSALCGEYIAYLTNCGLYLFNGATSVLAENSRFDEIDVTQEVKAVSFEGRYYALVYHKSGGRAIYCYDPEWHEGYFIENGAADIASGDDLYFTRDDGYIYRLTERGASKGFTPHFTLEGVALSLGEESMLRSVLIDGEGEFSITITSNRGSRTVKGSAGEALKLRSPLRGNGYKLKVSIEGEAQEARFIGLHLCLTEENNGN